MNQEPRTKLDLSEFDEIGVKPAVSAKIPQDTNPPTSSNEVKTNTPPTNLHPPENPNPSATNNTTSSNPPLPPLSQDHDEQKKPVKKNSVHPKKVVIGCLIFFFALFGIMIIAMVFGLRAGEETIMSFGLSPVSLKNWTIGMVNMLFGALALVAVISIIHNLSQRILAEQNNLVKKAKASIKSALSGVIFVVLLSLWFFVYSYISRFEMKPPELPIEIVTNPTYTFELTSPLKIDFSAERITDKFKKNYDIVSYEWDKEGDGKIDNTGQKVTLHFPHGGKKNGVYEVVLSIWLQPKGGGDMVMKEYQKTISISKQEIYGEIEADLESGDVPLRVKFNADEIADPSGSQIINYSWDLDADNRPDRDGFTYRKTEWTFDTIGTHTISLTVTSEDFNDDGTHEEKTFEKIITVHTPADSADTDVWIEAIPKKGFAPLTVNFSAQQESGVTNSKASRVDKYEWNIGDGLESLSGQRNKFTFEKPGTYPVELVVTFFNGQVKRDMVEITVNDESIAPEAIIMTEPKISSRYKAVTGPAPLEVEFDASESKDPDDNIVKYEWDFDGDGLWDEEGSLVKYKFWDKGDYETTLRITDADGNKSRAEIAIKVEEEIATIDFGVNKLAGVAPLTIDFDASGSRLPDGKKIISYEWDFNPEDTSTEKQTLIYERAQTSYVFDTIGEHFVKLTLHADDETKYFDTLKIITTHPSMNAGFSASRLRGDAPLTISFDASKSSGNITRYEWNFNDGTISAEKNVTHIFEKAGIYEVILSVYDALGNISRISETISVN